MHINIYIGRAWARARAHTRSVHFHFFKNLVVSGGWRKKIRNNNASKLASKQTNYKVNIMYIVNGLAWFWSWSERPAEHESRIYAVRSLYFSLFVRTFKHFWAEELLLLLLSTRLAFNFNIIINVFCARLIGQVSVTIQMNKLNTLSDVVILTSNLVSDYEFWYLCDGDGDALILCVCWCAWPQSQSHSQRRKRLRSYGFC